jgi:hypothetical protein
MLPLVRNALQMPSSRVSLGGGGGLVVPPAALLSGVRQLMMPQAQPGTVEAQLYSLNVYGPDGFFKAHRDTPRGADMFGSLVVCLPVEHAGGTLVVRAPSLRGEVRHDWGGSGLLEGAAGRLAWAAFFSDCEHEVLPVTSGHRVTLAFNLVSVCACGRHAGGGGCEEHSLLVVRWQCISPRLPDLPCFLAALLSVPPAACHRSASRAAAA